MLSREMRKSSARDFGFAFDFSARIDQCDKLFVALSPTLPCPAVFLFFLASLRLEYFEAEPRQF